MVSYELRRGRPADARIVRNLFFAILREHGLLAIDAPHLGVDLTTFGGSDPSQDDFVAVSGGKVVGFVIVVPAPGGGGEILKVFVKRSHRGRGLGTMLLARAAEVAKQRGYTSLRLTTTDAFAGAHAYYEKHGWVRDSADGEVPIAYSMALREVPRLVAPVPLFLRAILFMLEWGSGLAARLKRDLAAQREE